MPVDPWVLVVALVVTAVAAAVQGVIGIGFAVLSVPILSLLNPALAPVPQLLVTLPLTLSMAWRERHAVDLGGVGWIILGRLPGAAIGVALLKLASARALDVIIAIIVIGAVAILGAGVTLRITKASQFTAGVFSGVAALVASIGGPPLALLYRRRTGETIRASLAAVFSIGLLITIATRIVASEISWQDVRIAVVLFPALIVGYLASGRLRRHVEGGPIRFGILVLSAAAAAGLLVRAAG